MHGRKNFAAARHVDEDTRIVQRQPADGVVGKHAIVAAETFAEGDIAGRGQADHRHFRIASRRQEKGEAECGLAGGAGAIILSEVSLQLKAGDALGLIGPSGGGKTSLAKGIVGVWPLLRGSVRLDEADLKQWRTEAFGQAVGYLPQDVSLMDGTIAENISRFTAEPDARKIVEAAKAANVHELIVRLPDGYQTDLGPSGSALSAGQRQRIGLARALYGDPFLVVLDEPNSNLDAEGEAALAEAIVGVRARGGIVIVIAHRPSALSAVDHVGIVQAGKLIAFGPKDEILKHSGRSAPTPIFAKRVAAE